jgi:hypothetical protein
MRPWIESLRRLSWSTGFMDDSETSNMIDQYGPACGSLDFGLLPLARYCVGSLTDLSG